MFALELVVILLAVILLGGLVAPRIRVAAPIVLLVAGVLLGFAPALRDVHLPPEVMLLVFLPALLFWESITTSLQGIRANFRGIVLASTLLVVATAAAVATASHLVLGLPWGAAWVLGAAVAPTDATAVAALSHILPRRSVITLRAESLVNDGTALVLYGVAVGVTVSEEATTVGGIAGEFALSYGGGIAVGAAIAGIGILLRKRIRDVMLGNVVFLLLPFTAFLGAEFIHASGVLAVVVCGLVMTQVGPRIGDAATRAITMAFWRLATFVINAALFVLIGIEAQTAVRNLETTDLLTAILGAVMVWVIVLIVRYGSLAAAAFSGRLVSRRERGTEHPVGQRSNIVSTLAGFRGAVSLAVALAIPQTLANGDPFPGRDVIIFVTTAVVALTLIVQGLLLPIAVRWARFPDDDAPLQERLLAAREATETALQALDAIAEELGTSREVVDSVRGEVEERLRVTTSSDGDDDSDTGLELQREHQQLRLALLRKERETVVALRDEGRIDDAVLREVQSQLDIEEVRLVRSTPESEQ